MILVDGEKYACEQCIRGHRSSTCKHIQRPLVLVRSRGRPSTDSFQRIAIFAEEIKDGNGEDEIIKKESKLKTNLLKGKFISSHNIDFEENAIPERKSCCLKKDNENKNDIIVKSENSPCCDEESTKTQIPKSSCSCCSTDSIQGCQKKSKSIFVLKAAKRQVYNVEKDSLRLLDPVVEIPNSKVGLEIIQKVSKHKKMHLCRNTKIKEDLIQALRSGNEKDVFGSCCSGKRKGAEKDSIQSRSNPFLHQFKVSMNKPNKLKDDNYLIKRMALQNQNLKNLNETHPNISQQFNQDILYSNTNNSNSSSSIDTPGVPAQQLSSNSLLYDLYIADSCTVPGSCSCEPDSCRCPDCTEHGQFKNSKLSVKQQFEQFPFPINDLTTPELNQNSDNKLIRSYGKVEMQSSVPQFEQSFLHLLHNQSNNGSVSNKMSESTSPSDADVDECYCEADRCCCFNCIEHGIINGIRISDGSSVLDANMPFEIQLTHSQLPLYENSPSSTLSTPTGLPIDDFIKNSAPNSEPVSQESHSTIERDRWLEDHHQHYISNQNIEFSQSEPVIINNNLGNNYNNTTYENNSTDSNLTKSQDQILSTLLDHNNIDHVNGLFQEESQHINSGQQPAYMLAQSMHSSCSNYDGESCCSGNQM